MVGKNRGLVRAGRRLAPTASRPSRAGWTLLEIIIAFSVLSIGMLGYTQAIAKIGKVSELTREQSIALEAARSMLANISGGAFADLFRLYNQDPSDDPLGANTAPGGNFAVAGLTALAADPDGLAGAIEFPATPPAGGAVELRENLPDSRFGTPRDLNGDGAVDAANHAADYRLLPVVVSVSWQSSQGPRQIRLKTLLANLP